jgi:hypothetical protein
MHCARKLTSDPSATGTYIHAICSAGTRLNIVREAKLRKAEDARRRLHQSALNRFKCGSRAIYLFSHSAQHDVSLGVDVENFLRHCDLGRVWSLSVLL